MKTRKREFIAVLALLIGAALMLSGCPGAVPDPDDGGGDGPPPGGNGEPLPYYIRPAAPTPHGEIDHPSTADVGDLVTITLKGIGDYEPENLHIYYTGNNTIAPTRTDYYTYTFTMPKGDVYISVVFSDLLAVAGRATTAIDEYRTWIEIGYLNGLIRKLQDKNMISGYTTAANNAIIKLIEGQFDTSTNAYTPPTGIGEGVIQRKIRSEPLTNWIPSLVNPSYPMDKGSEIMEGTTHVNRTHVYYVKENNPGIPASIPTMLNLGKGWEAGTPFPTTAAPAGPNLDGVVEVPLIYKVGYNQTVTYQMWLWPVAQYTIEYAAGATGTTVTLQDYAEPTANTSSPPGATWKTRDGEQQFTNSSAQRRTGNVGKVATITGIVREVYVSLSITVSPATVYRLITVTDSSGNYVRNVSNPAGNNVVAIESGKAFSINTYTDAAVTSSNPKNWVGAFYPESKQYTIKVVPVTPFDPPPIVVP